MRRTSIALLVLALMACRPAPVEPVTVTGAWAGATPPGATVGAAYMEILAAEGDTLIAARSAAAERVEMHMSREQDGMMTMTPLERVPLPAGEPFKFEPGGAHLMLMGLRAPLTAGTSIPLTLRFEVAGEQTLEVSVNALGSMSPSHEH